MIDRPRVFHLLDEEMKNPSDEVMKYSMVEAVSRRKFCRAGESQYPNTGISHGKLKSAVPAAYFTLLLYPFLQYLYTLVKACAKRSGKMTNTK